MADFDVNVTRDGRWWMVDVAGVGLTQAESEAEVEEMALDLIVTTRQIPAEDVNMRVRMP